MTKSGRRYLRRAARAASCSPAAKKELLRSLTRQLEALEKDDPHADAEGIDAALGSPEQAVGEYEAALPESEVIIDAACTAGPDPNAAVQALNGLEKLQMQIVNRW